MEDSKLARRAELFNSLTEEQKQKISTFEDDKALLDYLSAEGIELPDDALDKIAGGFVLSEIATYIRVQQLAEQRHISLDEAYRILMKH